MEHVILASMGSAIKGRFPLKSTTTDATKPSTTQMIAEAVRDS